MPAAGKRRILFVATHPVQYAVPLFRRMAADPRLEIQAAFLSLAGARLSHDAGFGAAFQWDIPLLDGYPWLELGKPQARALRRLMDDSRWDAIVLHTGYRYTVFWAALLLARRRGIPVLFGADATDFETQTGKGAGYKSVLKKLVLPWIFRLADVAIVPSTRSRDFLLGMGLDVDRVVVTPYVVDNDWWRSAAQAADRAAVRRSWNVPIDATVFLFCAKLQAWKRPHDVLSGIARLADSSAFLIFAGEGPLRADLERSASALGISERTRFLGFANQSELPAIYGAADVLVLPSEYEPFGVVVNEAMLCGCVPIVSDRVGAGGDLVGEGESGIKYPVGDTQALTHAMSALSRDAALLERLRAGAAKRVAAWSPQLNIQRLIQAVDMAVQRRPPSP
jgi:glycosyltransferase involved in cell wall biosynthesis